VWVAWQVSVPIIGFISFDHFQSGLNVNFITRWLSTFTASMRALGISFASSAADEKFFTSISMTFLPLK
jgi:hypothetical protein